MRAAFEHVEPTAELSWTGFRATADRYAFSWHFHPELELTLITRGSGTLFVGDSISDYRAGDLVLTGPALPHTYVSGPGDPGQDAVVIQFRPDFLGAGLTGRPEFRALPALFDRAGRGLLITAAPWSRRLRALDRLPPPRRTLALLDLLLDVAEHPGGRPLTTGAASHRLDRAAADRIDAIVELLHTAYAQPLSLAAVAARAHLTPSAVSRFFRRTTGMTITGYLNRVRINAACRMLTGTDRSVAQIAGRCGYPNLSHFNRQFRALTAVAPTEFRRQVGHRPPDLRGRAQPGHAVDHR